MTHYDAYGSLATKDVPETLQNGRYMIQGDAEKNILDDIKNKLRFRPEDSLLDIGCGLGLCLIPLSAIIREGCGCDHPNVIEKLRRKEVLPNISYKGGNFLELDFDRSYTKILVYSVLPALPDRDTVFAFVDKALDVLAPDGRMLLGDLANADKRRRFQESGRGRAFQKEWREKAKDTVSHAQAEKGFSDSAVVSIDDGFVLNLIAHIRRRGFHAYIVDQPQNLPFGNSREDILVVGPEYKEE